MSLQNLSNDEVAAGLGEHLREAERRAAEAGHDLISKLLGAAHKILDLAQTIAHGDGQVTTLSGGTEKGP